MVREPNWMRPNLIWLNKSLNHRRTKLNETKFDLIEPKHKPQKTECLNVSVNLFNFLATDNLKRGPSALRLAPVAHQRTIPKVKTNLSEFQNKTLKSCSMTCHLMNLIQDKSYYLRFTITKSTTLLYDPSQTNQCVCAHECSTSKGRASTPMIYNNNSKCVPMHKCSTSKWRNLHQQFIPTTICVCSQCSKGKHLHQQSTTIYVCQWGEEHNIQRDNSSHSTKVLMQCRGQHPKGEQLKF